MNRGATPEAAAGRRGVSRQGCVLHQSKGQESCWGSPPFLFLALWRGHILAQAPISSSLPNLSLLLPKLRRSSQCCWRSFGVSGRTSNSPIPWCLKSPPSLPFPMVGPGAHLVDILALPHPFLPVLSFHTPFLSWTSQTLN